jgi:hypothetical protein
MERRGDVKVLRKAGTYTDIERPVLEIRDFLIALRSAGVGSSAL